MAEGGHNAIQDNAGFALCGIQAVEHGFDGGFSAEAVDHVQARTETDLGVDGTF